MNQTSYYYENKSYTYFSSEIKPIINFKKKINISDYFSYQFLVNQSMDFDDKTFFENVKAVKPGEFIIFKKNSKKIKKKILGFKSSKNRQ